MKATLLMFWHGGGSCEQGLSGYRVLYYDVLACTCLAPCTVLTAITAAKNKPDVQATSPHVCATNAHAPQTGAEAGPAPKFVTTTQSPLGLNATDFDVVVCGGTLGIFMAAALSMKGWRVGVIERGPLRGRAQEWNISRKEMEELVEVWQQPAECMDTEFHGLILESFYDFISRI